MTEFDSISPEVFVVKKKLISMGDKEVEFIKSKAIKSPRKRARICAHQSNSDALHEMFIAISSKSYIRPHKHFEKSESFHIIEGGVDVIIFDEYGEINDVIKLGEKASGRNYYYKLSESKFHTLIIHSDILVMHEITNGPFEQDQSVYASFSPEEDDAEAVIQYIETLSIKSEEFGRG